MAFGGSRVIDTESVVAQHDHHKDTFASAYLTKDKPPWDLDPALVSREPYLDLESVDQLSTLRPVIDSCLSILQLKPGWDSYGALKPRADLVLAGLYLVAELLRGGAPAPSVVPTAKGGVQFEWYREGRELEIEVLSKDRLMLAYEDESNGDFFEDEVDRTNISSILEQIEKLVSVP